MTVDAWTRGVTLFNSFLPGDVFSDGFLFGVIKL